MLDNLTFWLYVLLVYYARGVILPSSPSNQYINKGDRALCVAFSAIPSMQKLLNKEHQKQKRALKSLLSPTNYALY